MVGRWNEVASWLLPAVGAWGQQLITTLPACSFFSFLSVSLLPGYFVVSVLLLWALLTGVWGA